MKKVTLKDVCWVALINIGVLALAVYVWISYNHRQKIFNSEEPILNYSVLKVRCKARKNVIIHSHRVQWKAISCRSCQK